MDNESAEQNIQPEDVCNRAHKVHGLSGGIIREVSPKRFDARNQNERDDHVVDRDRCWGQAFQS